MAMDGVGAEEASFREVDDRTVAEVIHTDQLWRLLSLRVLKEQIETKPVRRLKDTLLTSFSKSRPGQGA